MTKNLLAVAVAAALTVPFAAANAASHGGSDMKAADISFGGSARYRFASTKSAPKVGTETTSDTHDSRVRFNVTAKLDGGVKVYTQFENDTDRNGTEDTRVDQAYMVVPMGPVTLTAGDQKATWGNGFHVNSDKKKNRVKLGMKVNKTTSVGVFSDPKTVTGGTFDGQAAGVTLVTKMSGFKMGLLHKPKGAMTDIFVDGMIDASHTMIKFEYVTQDGALKSSATAEADSKTGMFLQVAQPLSESLVVFGAMVSTTAGYQANDDFGPVSTVGNGANKTAWAGMFDRWGLTLGDTSAMLGGVMLPNAGGMGMDVNFILGSGEGTMTHANTTTTMAGAGSKDAVISLSMLDLQVSKKVAKNATLKATYGTIAADYDATLEGMGMTDTDYTAAGLVLSTKF